MCGRYVMAKATGDLVAELGIEHVVGEELRPSWNVAPTQQVRIVTGRGSDGGPGGPPAGNRALGPGPRLGEKPQRRQ